MTAPTIKVKIQRRPTLKLKVLPKFPASVTADSPVTLDRTGGNYTFGLDVDELQLSLDPRYAKLAGGNAFTGSQTIATTAASVDKALSITQSSPASGNSVGPLDYNKISITNTYNTTGSTRVDGVDGTYITALKLDFYNRGTNLGTSSLTGFFSQMHLTTSAINGGSDKNAIIGFVYGNIADSSAAGWTGVVGSTAVDVGGSTPAAIGAEFDTGIATGGSATKRYGVRVLNYGAVQATGNDAAFSVANLTAGAAGITGSTGGAYKNMFLLSNEAGGYPISQTGSILKADAAFTVGSVLDLANMTVTGNILSFPNAKWTGAGVLTAGAGTAAAAPTGAMVNATITSGGIGSLISQVDGVANFSGFFAGNSTAATNLYAVTPEPSSASTIFGQTNGNWAEIVSTGTASHNGMLLGTLVNKPVIIGANNTERLRLLTGGTLTSTDANALAVGRQGATNPVLQVDASTATVATGLKVKGAAAAGGLALSVITSGTNEGLTIDAAGSGAVKIGATSTGDIQHARNTNISLTAPTVAADAPLTINGNTAASIAPPSGTLLHMIGADTGLNRIVMDTYAQTSVLAGYRANGTQASKTAVVAGNSLFVFGANGWNTAAQVAGAQISFEARETFSGTASGTSISVSTTPLTTTGVAESTRFQPSGGVSVGATSIATDPGIGSIQADKKILSSGATSGIGYSTGAGGAVTQGTSRTTGVTVNNVCGAITLFSQINTAVSQATAQSFTVTNSAVAATDVIVVNQKSGTDKYEIFITNVAAGSFQITNYAVAGTTNEAPVFNFAVIKAVAA